MNYFAVVEADDVEVDNIDEEEGEDVEDNAAADDMIEAAVVDVTKIAVEVAIGAIDVVSG